MRLLGGRGAAGGRASRSSTSWPARRPAGSSSPSRRPASSASAASSPRRSATPTATTHREFRRGFRIEPGERVLLVDDILTTGGSLLAMVPAVEAAGGEIVGLLRHGRPLRRDGRPGLADDRAAVPGAGALAARDPDVRAGRRRPARAAPTGRRCTRRGARGPPPADAERRTPEDSAADARQPPGRWRDRRITARAARVHAAGRPPLAPASADAPR